MKIKAVLIGLFFALMSNITSSQIPKQTMLMSVNAFLEENSVDSLFKLLKWDSINLDQLEIIRDSRGSYKEDTGNSFILKGDTSIIRTGTLRITDRILGDWGNYLAKGFLVVTANLEYKIQVIEVSTYWDWAKDDQSDIHRVKDYNRFMVELIDGQLRKVKLKK